MSAASTAAQIAAAITEVVETLDRAWIGGKALPIEEVERCLRALEHVDGTAASLAEYLQEDELERQAAIRDLPDTKAALNTLLATRVSS